MTSSASWTIDYLRSLPFITSDFADFLTVFRFQRRFVSVGTEGETLQTALTGVVGIDAFLSDFDLYFAKLFDGLRHDSGEPVERGEKALAHYAKLRIDANKRRLVFSDALDLPTTFALYRHFADRTMTGFGIGTNLTSDTGLQPLHIVMKLMKCNCQPVAKLSDSPGKTVCMDATFLPSLRQVHSEPAV